MDDPTTLLAKLLAEVGHHDTELTEIFDRLDINEVEVTDVIGAVAKVRQDIRLILRLVIKQHFDLRSVHSAVKDIGYQAGLDADAAIFHLQEVIQRRG